MDVIRKMKTLTTIGLHGGATVPRERFLSLYDAGVFVDVPEEVREIGGLPVRERDERLARLRERVPADPGAPGSLNSVAWKMLTSSREEERNDALALPLAQIAVDATERAAPHILDTLALALFRNGDVAGAVVAQEEAISKLPSDTSAVERAEYAERLETYQSAAGGTD
jgi:hypothetical protein